MAEIDKKYVDGLIDSSVSNNSIEGVDTSAESKERVRRKLHEELLEKGRTPQEIGKELRGEA